MRIHFCGVRGSMPAAGTEFARVGGNTSSLAVAHDGAVPTLLVDGGTGLRNVTELLGSAPFQGTIVLGHLHLDHVMGLPFFRSGDHPEARVRLLLPAQGADPEELLARAIGPPFFPITSAGLRGSWQIDTYDEGTFAAEGFTVLAREVPHKGGRTMGLRVSDATGSFAYLSDHAPQNLGPGPDGVGVLHEAAVELARDVDVLVHGAQYTRDELPARWDFGHTAADYGVALAAAAGARRLVLFHHDPWRTDDAVAEIHRSLAAAAPVPVDVAVEGTAIDTGATS